MRYILYYLLIPILMIGCGESGSSTSDEVKESVNLTVKIGYDDSILSREIKRVKLNDVKNIQLSIFDSKKSYLINTQFNQTDSGSWELEVSNLPINRDITFVAEAFNSENLKILEGNVKQQISNNSYSVVIPLNLAQSELIISLPVIESITAGDIIDSNITEVKRVTFSIVNPNSEEVKWAIVPDKALEKYGEFFPKGGVLDFRFKNQIDFTLDLNITNNYVDNENSERLYFKDLTFENKLEINTSLGDRTTTFFNIYEQRNSLKVSIAPIVDNIYLERSGDKISANAIIDSKLLKSEKCSNSFNDLVIESFQMNKLNFETLFLHYYSSVEKTINVNKIIENLKSDILNVDNPSESNLTKLFLTDINDSFDSLFQVYQINYGYSNEHFNQIYTYLTDDGFVEMLDYYQSSEKDFIVALKSFYRSDSNFSNTIENYIDVFGKKGFTELVDYMINSSESTLLIDYNFDDRNFTQNADYYYLKFKSDNNQSKENLHTLIEKTVDYDFNRFLKLFNEDGKKLYKLIEFYFNDYNIYEPEFATLLNFIIDENFELLFNNLVIRYSTLESFVEFQKLVENRDFLEYLEYYKNPTSQLFYSIKSKYNEDICITNDFGQILYTWSLEKNPNSDKNLPYIENIHVNPIVILNSNGTLQDKLILEAENNEGIKTEYSYYININSWSDSDGNPIYSPISPESPDDNDSIPNNDEDPVVIPENPQNQDFNFNLTSNITKLDLLFNELKTVSFSVSKDFDVNLSNDIFGVTNREIFEISPIRMISKTEFEVDITANEIEGDGSFIFVSQNSGDSNQVEILISIKKPIHIYELRNSYSMLVGEKRDINFIVVNPRGDNIKFDIDNPSNSVDSIIKATNLYQTYEKNNTLTLIAKSEGEITFNLKVTDTTVIPEYSNTIAIKVNIIKSDDQKIQEAFLAKENDIRTCGDTNKDFSQYEYISDVYDVELTESGGAENSYEKIVSILSENSAYQANPAFSTLLILYPVGITSNNILSETFYVFNQNSGDYIGKIKYTSKAEGRDFYVKYYDHILNSVICEKHRF